MRKTRLKSNITTYFDGSKSLTTVKDGKVVETTRDAAKIDKEIAKSQCPCYKKAKSDHEKAVVKASIYNQRTSNNFTYTCKCKPKSKKRPGPDPNLKVGTLGGRARPPSKSKPLGPPKVKHLPQPSPEIISELRSYQLRYGNNKIGLLEGRKKWDKEIRIEREHQQRKREQERREREMKYGKSTISTRGAKFGKNE